MKTSTLLIAVLLSLCSYRSTAQVTGAIFKDFNGNGTKDANEPFAAGVIVNVYNASDALINTVTSTAPLTGSTNYTFTPAAYPIRIEFVIPASGTNCIDASYDLAGYKGSVYGSNVRFLSAASSTVNFALNNPNEYAPNTNPYVYNIRQVAGDPNTGTGTATTNIVLEATPFLANLGSPGTTTPAQRKLANSALGSSYGIAYSKQSGKIFTSAFIRRHAGLGTQGSGGIYVMDTALTAASNFYNLDANGYPTRTNSVAGAPAFGATSSFTVPTSETITYLGTTDAVSGLPLGQGVIGSNSARGLTTNASNQNNDPSTYGQVGIYGLGDLDMSEDGSALYTINLYDRKLYKLTLNSVTNPTGVASVSAFTLPAPPSRGSLSAAFFNTYGADNSQFYDGTKGRLRPFALKFYRGKLYVGAVTTGEGVGAATTTDNNTGNPEYTDLWAYVFVFDPATNTWASAPALQFPLNFARGTDGDSFDETFRLWRNTSMASTYTWNTTSIRLFYAQAMLTDIAFDPEDGSMILGLRDRVGDQVGHFQYKLSGTNTEVATCMGDMLRAYKTSSCTFELESNAKEGASSTKAATPGINNSQGPGNGEFYYQDNVYDAPSGSTNANWHLNTGEGSVICLPGSGTVAATTMDPANAWQQGIDWHSNATGANVRNHVIELSDGATVGNAGKGNGLGDMEMINYEAPVEIGNRVWADTNNDGIQTAGEAGIANVTLELFADFNNDGIPDGAALASTNTSSGAPIGEWYFNASNVTDGDPVTAGNQPGLKINSYYIVRVASSDWTGSVGVGDLAGYQLTATGRNGNGAPGLSNNDASIQNTIPSIRILVGGNGFNNHNYDFGFKTSASLGDKVWLDNGAGAGTANNGVQDGTEPGVAGVTVSLYNSSNAVIATTVTDAYGYYLFDNLTPGDYTVGFTLPANYTFTTQTNTTDDNNVTGSSTTGSDANVTTGKTYTITLSAGENNRNIDAGLIFNTPPVTQSLGNTVWLDTDKNGVQNGTEPGVASVVVTLYNAAGVAVGATITDANGKYLFSNIATGTYAVGFTLPVGMQFTTQGGTLTSDLNSDANVTTGRTNTITVNSGDNITYVDAGIYPIPTTTASLGDRVWYDTNHDGIQDANEPGVAGITVKLYINGNPTSIATAITDPYGYYMFTNLAANDYIVEFIKPSTYTFSPQKVVTATSLNNSDPSTTTGKTSSVNLKAGDRNASIDAGIYLSSVPGTLKLGDYVWYDLNNDGIQGATEQGIAGVTATLYRNGTDGLPGTSDDVLIDTAFTDINGFYIFPDLAASISAATQYNVQFSNLPANYSFTKKGAGTTATDNNANSLGRTATINLTADDMTIDAGIIQGVPAGKGTLGDRVWYDLNNNGRQDAGELGVGGVTVTLQKDLLGNGIFSTLATTTTNALGNYLFGGLDAGSYKVVFSNMPTGYVISPQNAVVAADDTNSDGDNGGTTIAGATTSTTAVYTLATGEDNLTIDLGIVPAANTNTLGDFVWYDTNSNGVQDAGETGVQGVSVTLYNSGGTAIAYTTTDVNGNYLFSGLADGTYSVGFANFPAGFDLTSKSISNDLTGSDADILSGKTTTVTLNYAAGGTNRDNRSLDAGLITIRAALGNYVWLDANGDGVQDASEKGIAGVTVILYASDGTTILASTITDANGKYLFPNLTAGSYIVGFSTVPTNLSFTQQNTPGDNQDNTNSDASPSTGKTSIIVLSAGETDLTIDAGLRPTPTATVGDYVWSDLNSNGIQDSDEPGIGGVIATLYDSGNNPIGSAVTDGNGKYLITNVPPGTGYYIIFSNSPNNPSGLQPTFTLQGSAVGTNTSHADATGKTNTFTVNYGDNIRNIDAGIKDYPGRAILALQNIDIAAALHGTTTTVTWVTTNEVNTDKFIVERSTDNTNFIAVGEKKGAGTYAGNTTYALNDDVSTITAGTVIYYRIKAVDNNTRTSYSKIVTVRISNITGIRTWPSPFTAQINIAVNSSSTQQLQVRLTDMSGRLVKTDAYAVTRGNNQVTVSGLSGLSKGMYTIKIAQADGTTIASQLIIKN